MFDPRLSRREFLELAAASPLTKWIHQTGAPLPDRAQFLKATGKAIPAEAGAVVDVRVGCDWKGPIGAPFVLNRSDKPVRIKEVVLFEIPHAMAPATKLYGEGFQMLSQTGGTVAKSAALGNYTDAGHYKMIEPAGSNVFHSLLLLSDSSRHTLMSFSSCRRFSGQIRLTPSSLSVVVDTEGLTLGPRERWPLEELMVESGRDREALLAALGRRIAINHPPIRPATPPSGWCSWYCFGPKVTAQQVLDNLDAIATNVPGLRYIQIDDGYQPAMGDWLETGTAFGGEVQSVLKAIRARGFEPAIWVAPFIAEQGSRLFRDHPDWFVKDADGAPLRSDKVTFGGWRRGPWYALDGTHPAARAHVETVFRTMRTEWGCTYFKLDANFWGAIHGGRFHDPAATRIEAYRRGMEAVRRGAGSAFLLGCNHPIWPSLGLIHGSRSSNDIKRTWARVATTARQNLMRNWQNGSLWWNDPDAVCVTGTELTQEEVRFHATAIYASGGMILSGDDLTKIPADRLEILRKLQPPTGVAARFADDSLRVGAVDLKGQRIFCLLNWDDTPQTIAFRLEGSYRIRELWTGQDEGRHAGGDVARILPPHSGRVLICT